MQSTTPPNAFDKPQRRSFLVPRKVRFLAMTMFEQARHRSFGLTKTCLTTWRKNALTHA